MPALVAPPANGVRRVRVRHRESGVNPWKPTGRSRAVSNSPPIRSSGLLPHKSMGHVLSVGVYADDITPLVDTVDSEDPQPAGRVDDCEGALAE